MKELIGTKIAILVENLFEDLELLYPKLRMKEAGAEIVLIGPEVGEYKSKHGYPVKTHHRIQDVKTRDFDAVIIPGGYAPDLMRRHPKMVQFVRDMCREQKTVAAICHAGWMLASAAIVEGKRITCWPSIKDDMIHAGARYEDSEVVQDGNIITSRMPSDLPAFCRTIIESLMRGRAGFVSSEQTRLVAHA